jgi:hypothetical protein
MVAGGKRSAKHYTGVMSCAICQKRRPKRYCPGVRAEICPVCCGTEREVTVRCPSDCEFLIEARRHERPMEIDPEKIPHQDVQLSDEFIESNADLITVLSAAIVMEADRSRLVDSDAREALAGLIQTYRTLQNGVIYESVPANPLAARLYRALQEAGAEFLKNEKAALGMARTRDGDVMRALVFLHIFSLDRNNGRPFGRSFLDALPRPQLPDDGTRAEDTGSPLILP